MTLMSPDFDEAARRNTRILAYHVRRNSGMIDHYGREHPNLCHDIFRIP